MNTRELAPKNEKALLEAIKTFPKTGEYYEVSYVTLANKSEVPYGSIPNIIKRLERKKMIEVKTSFFLFGTMKKKGIKILGEFEKESWGDNEFVYPEKIYISN